MFSSSPITASSLPARRLRKSPIALSACAKRYPRRRAQRHKSTPKSLPSIVEGSDYRLPHDLATHAVALDPKSLAIARRGSLYPDHVVFLGPGLVEASVDGGRLRAPPEGRRPPLMMALPGLGVVLHRSTSKNAEAMARCLADVAARIPEEAPIRVLTGAEEQELMNWEAEAYRQSIGR